MIRNLVGLVLVWATLLGFFLATPTQPPPPMQLECGDQVIARFPDVASCTSHPRWASGCGCRALFVKPVGLWFLPLLAPIVTAALGSVIFTGSLFRRLLLLNLAVGVGLLMESIRTVKSIAAPRVLPYDALEILIYVASFSVFFAFFHWLRRLAALRRAAVASGQPEA